MRERRISITFCYRLLWTASDRRPPQRDWAIPLDSAMCRELIRGLCMVAEVEAEADKSAPVTAAAAAPESYSTATTCASAKASASANANSGAATGSDSAAEFPAQLSLDLDETPSAGQQPEIVSVPVEAEAVEPPMTPATAVEAAQMLLDRHVDLGIRPLPATFMVRPTHSFIKISTHS